MRRFSCREDNLRLGRAAPKAPSWCQDRVTWHCLGGRGLSWLLGGGRAKSDLLHLFGNSSSCRSLPLPYPRQIRLLCTSLLEAAAYGHVLRNAKLENKSSSNFIPKPCLHLMKQIPGFASHGAGKGFGTPRHPRRGWQLQGMGVLTSLKRIKMKPFLPHSFSEDHDRVGFTGWGFTSNLQRSSLHWQESILAWGYVSAPGCPRCLFDLFSHSCRRICILWRHDSRLNLWHKMSAVTF